MSNAAALAERLGGEVDLVGRGVLVPNARLPAGNATEDGALARLAFAGARRLYPAAFRLRAEVRRRLEKELGVIAHRFSGYFLMAREAAAGIARCLGLTTPCPFAHRLLFEHFLHEGRKDPTDIALDFCNERRDRVRDELMCRYTDVGAAVAATANTLSLRGAVRVAGRALGYSPAEKDALARNVPRRIRDRDRLVNYESEWDADLRYPAKPSRKQSSGRCEKKRVWTSGSRG